MDCHALPTDSLAALVDEAPIGLFVLENGRFIHANRTFAETLGYTQAEIVALSSATEIAHELINLSDAPTRRTVQARRRDGTMLEGEIRTRVAAAAGKRVVVGALDITQLDRLTSIGRLAAQIAHEFNNVLMGIQPIVDVARRCAAGDPQRLRLPDLIAASIARGKRITTEVLRFGRPVQPALRSVDAGELLRQIGEEIRPTLPDAIQLVLREPATPLHVVADPAQLSQVLINLALNARDAMETKGGLLSIGARRSECELDEPSIEFTVADTGCGIGCDDLPFIFEPLFSTKRHGTGLGLPIVHQIVTAHRGHLRVESDPGKGTSFHVRIPAVVQEAQEEPALDDVHAKAEALPRRVRVLLVDDDVAIVEGLQWTLESEGIDVSAVMTASAVLPAIARFHPDVVVLDLGLPDEDGRNVYARIAERFDVPVVFSTGHAREHEIAALLASPRTAFLMKPYSTAELLQTIDGLLG